MTDPHDDGVRPAHDGDGPPGVPRWVKLSGIAVAVLILLLIVVMLVSGGEHGPGRHGSGAPAGGPEPAAAVAAGRDSTSSHR